MYLCRKSARRRGRARSCQYLELEDIEMDGNTFEHVDCPRVRTCIGIETEVYMYSMVRGALED